MGTAAALLALAEEIATTRNGLPAAPIVEASDAPPAITEHAPLPKPTLLSECAPYNDFMYAKSSEERIREAVNTIKYAVQDGAFDGLTDDGRVMRKLGEGETDPWAAVEAMVLSEINVNKIKTLIARGKDILAGYKA